MEVVNISGHSNLVRDLSSKAILNTDCNQIERYKLQARIFEDAKQKMNDIEYLKAEIEELKEMIKRISK